MICSQLIYLPMFPSCENCSCWNCLFNSCLSNNVDKPICKPLWLKMPHNCRMVICHFPPLAFLLLFTLSKSWLPFKIQFSFSWSLPWPFSEVWVLSLPWPEHSYATCQHFLHYWVLFLCEESQIVHYLLAGILPHMEIKMNAHNLINLGYFKGL